LRRKSWLIFIILTLTLAPGCWGRVEINEAYVPVGLGMDLTRENKLVSSVQVALPEKVKARPFTTMAAAGDTAAMALRATTLFTPRQQLAQHVSTFVLGENMARHLADAADLLFRSNFIRETGDVFIARGSTAREVLEVPTPVEKLPARALVSMVRSQDPSTGIYTEVTLSEILGKIAAPGIEPVIPGVKIVEEKPGEKKLRLSGMAVFRKEKLVGWLNETESRGYRWLRPQGVTGGTKIVLSPVGGEPVMLETLQGRSKIEPEIAGDGRIIIHINIREEANFYEERDLDNLLTPENLKKLEQQGSKEIEAEVLAAVNKAIELDSDIFGFGLAISRTHPREWAKIEQDWARIFPTVEVRVQAISEIRRSGLLTRILNLRE